MGKSKRTRLGGGVVAAKDSFASMPVMKKRFFVVLSVFLAGFLLVIFRLIYIQGIIGPELKESASQARTREYIIHGKRGDILDSSGAVLATSIERYNVGVNQKLIGEYVRHGERKNSEGDGTEEYVNGTGAAAAAEELAPLLGLDRAELGGLLLGPENPDDKSTFVYIKRDISPELWRKIQALQIPGIEPEQYIKRVYPNENVAGNILGYVGEDGSEENKGVLVGRMGIEATQDDILQGKDGKLKVEVVSDGAVPPQGYKENVAAQDGGTVKLTINRDLQNALMQSVDTSVARFNAEWGAAIVIEVGTGRILALVDSHSPNPANLSDTSPEDWGSRAVQAPVEPGSVGKIVTFSAALEEGKVTPDDVFTVPDQITMPNTESFRDSTNHATQNMTVAGILAKSYNTGLVQIGDTLDDKTRYSYMKSFGLGDKTGIELPAESSGLLSEPSQWDRRTRYTTMFGQGWAGTTLQVGQIMATVANDGVYVPLHIVDSVTSSDGIETPIVGEDQARRVVSSETAQTMLQMMQGVTQQGGTAPLARVDGYNIAGKTGTAQVADERGALTKRVSSFIGAIPAEDPQIAVAVVVFGASGPGYGGDVSAPVFHDVASFAVRQLGIPPSTTPAYRYAWTEEEKATQSGQ